MKKIIFIFVLMILTFSFTFSEEVNPVDLTWQGSVSINLDKQTFLETENITGQIRIDNLEEYPIVGGNLVIQVAKGQYDYPSQSSTQDNIVFEDNINNIWILPKDSKEIAFSIPPIKGAGDYRIDFYVSVLRSKHTGASWILLSPIDESFTITGNNYSRAEIFRPLTSFNGFAGPVGFPVQPEEEINGKIVIFNSTDSKKENLKLEIFMCDWSDTFCIPQKNIFEVPDVLAGEMKTVELKLKTPKIPSAYAINMILYSGDIVESIYKNRVIVSGGTAKVRKIFIDGLDTKNYSIESVISASPDHFTNPDFDNFSITIEALKETKIIATEKQNYDEFKFGEIMKQKIIVGEKDFDEACIRIEKTNIIFDEVCFDVNLGEIQTAYDVKYPAIVKVLWTHSENNNTLEIKLSKKLPINADLKVFTENTIVFEDTSRGLDNYSRIFQVEKKNYILIVDDLDAKRQQTFNLNFKLTEDEQAVLDNGNYLMGSSDSSCNGTICGNETVCDARSYISDKGICCTGNCVLNNDSSDTLILFGIPLIFWGALIILLIAILTAGTTIKKVKSK